MRRPSLALGAVLIVAAAISLTATTSPTSPAVSPGSFANGGFEVQVFADGSWQPAGALRFGSPFTEAVLALPSAALAEPEVRVRLVQHGGGAAHVDRVSLGPCAPTRLAGAQEPEALALALASDHDVLHATGRTIDLTFAGGEPGARLRVTARVEGAVVVGSPFAFPPANQFQPLTADSAFYRYRPAPGGRAPSWPEELDPAEALFAERCVPTTGHPEGVTFGWVANDRHTLYAAVEFTPDNTRDGDEDWASVQVATGGQIREFRVSERETRWGSAAFAPTATAPYRHKLYRFAIPFSELSLRDAAGAGELKLAFSAYGTAAVSWLSPSAESFGSIEVAPASAGTTSTTRDPTETSILLGTPWFTRGNPAASPFPVSPGTCGDGVTVPPGGTCTFTAAFAPTAVGPVADTLTFTAAFGTAPPQAAQLFLQGEGVPARTPPVPNLGPLGLAALALVLAGAGARALRHA